MVTPSHFLPSPVARRKLSHERNIQLQAYEREDGLLDLEALIEDGKPETFATRTRQFDSGVPIHLMILRLTVNRQMDVLEAQATMQRMPFPTICHEATASVQALVGANLFRGFRSEISRRIPRSERCSHLSELAALMPTLAVQTLMKEGEVELGNKEDTASRPLKIGGCHAYREDGPLVLKYYPQWYRKAED